MAFTVLTNAYIVINGIDLSDHGNQVEVDDQADDVDFTGYGASYRQHGEGLKDATITVAFFADFAPGKIHQTLQPLYATDSEFVVEVRPVNAPPSSTNPRAIMTARLYAYSGISGKTGDAATIEAAFRNADPAGLQWLTSLGLLLGPGLFLTPTSVL